MSLSLTPMTELDAVNTMLRHIGERPVNSLITQVEEANIARQILHNTSRKIQSQGLSCNTEYNYELLTDANSEIVVPSNALRIVASDPSIEVVLRDGKLYDRVNHTYEFDNSPLYVTIVFFLDFEDLDEVVRNYVAIVASREFQAQYVGDSTQYKLTELEEQKAYNALNANEIRQKKRNAFDHFRINPIVMRDTNPVRYYKGSRTGSIN